MTETDRCATCDKEYPEPQMYACSGCSEPICWDCTEMVRNWYDGPICDKCSDTLEQGDEDAISRAYAPI